jgi:hypothetical protein
MYCEDMIGTYLAEYLDPVAGFCEQGHELSGYFTAWNSLTRRITVSCSWNILRRVTSYS